MPTDFPRITQRDALRAQARDNLLNWQIVGVAFLLLMILISLDVGAVPTEFPDVLIGP